MLLFLALAFLLEYLIVYSFLSTGITDESTWVETFQVPYVNWSFTLTVSPLLHLLPLAVVIVLISSWIFLTKQIAFIPQRIGSAKKIGFRRRRPQRRRLKFVRNFSKRINRGLQKIGRAFRNSFLRIPGFSKLSRRLFFARTAIRGAMIILITFVCFALIAYSLAYPRWVHNMVINFYGENPSFMSSVIWVQQSFRSLGHTLAPIESIAAAINNALIAAGPGLKSSVQSLGASAAPIAQLDITEKYILVQNLGAWVCALIALACGKYASTRRYRTR
jgi:hypothetical protein